MIDSIFEELATQQRHQTKWVDDPITYTELPAIQ